MEPKDWVEHLSKKLSSRQARYEMLDDYAVGDHPLPEGSKHWEEFYVQWQRRSRTNYCGLASSAVSERMVIDGFRTGDESIDESLRSIWRRNRMDARSVTVHNGQTDYSDCYVLVGPGSDGVRITPESPRQCIIEVDRADPRHTLAGLKTWDEDEERFAELYLPESVHRFALRKDNDEDGYRPVGSAPNPMGEVPLFRFLNRPRLDGDGLAEFEDAIDVQDRINSLELQIMSIGQAQAWRQRWVKGLDLTDGEGNEIPPPFQAVVSALWAVEDPEVEFGEFSQVDLRPLLEARQAAVTSFVVITGLPPHYVAGDLVNASADAFAAAETRLSAKVRKRNEFAAQSWKMS